jgi:putative AlgH/UPF0301 family transcriptional regulator
VGDHLPAYIRAQEELKNKKEEAYDVDKNNLSVSQVQKIITGTTVRAPSVWVHASVEIAEEKAREEARLAAEKAAWDKAHQLETDADRDARLIREQEEEAILYEERQAKRKAYIEATQALDKHNDGYLQI